MTEPWQQTLQTVLSALKVPPDSLLGHGGEARVYALDRSRVVRISHGLVPLSVVGKRHQLIAELRSNGAPFELPDVIDQGEIAGRTFTIERRLPGRPVSELLSTLTGPARDALVEHHLEAAAALGTLRLQPRHWFGELISDPPLRTPTWPEYLVARAADAIERAPLEFHRFDAEAAAAALPECVQPSFVHLDAFAGNMLAEGVDITAVLDFGATCVVGDARLDPLSCAVYLSSPQITPTAQPRDIDVAMSWLRAARFAQWFEPARRWCAAFWSFAVDDAQLHHWCRSVVVEDQPLSPL